MVSIREERILINLKVFSSRIFLFLIQILFRINYNLSKTSIITQPTFGDIRKKTIFAEI